MKTPDQFDFRNQRVLVRVDFNVPLAADFRITDDSRMVGALPTIKKVLSDGGSVILMSHLGRPKNGPEKKFSLSHLTAHLEQLTGTKVIMAPDCVGNETKSLASQLKPGEILLLENLRFHKEEEAGDRSFAEQLASIGNFYINDAFGTAHRAHASTAVIADFFPVKKCFGFLMAAEIANADKILKNPQRPFTAIVGGAKVSDKLLILNNLIDIADNILIGGGMAYTFLRGMGKEIGSSLLEAERIDLTKELLAKAKQKGVTFLLPKDSVVADAFKNEANSFIADSEEIKVGWMALDIGPETIAEYSRVIGNSKTVLWNGPMGVFEMPAFEKGTRSIADALVSATHSGCYTLIGGGDSSAAIHKYGLADDVSYVSTGGGALLEYFEGKVLPGIQAILN
jgi:phosphoglycerate kinase